MAQENWYGVPVRFDLLPFGTRRYGQKLRKGKPEFLVAHDTGNINTNAQTNINYYKNTYNIDWNYVASAHMFVDDKECVICIPANEVAWHVLLNVTLDNLWYGVDANYGAVGVEGCYFENRERTKKSLDNMARVLAYLCDYWKIDYKTQMPGHQDIQANKQDPGNILAYAGYGRSTSNLDKLVAKYIGYDKKSKKEVKKEKVKPKQPTKVVNKDKEEKAKKRQEAISYMHSLKGKYIDFDKMYGYQCADVSVDYVYHITNGKVRMWGNAIDLPNNTFPKGWKVVRNYPAYVPPIGSVAVFSYGIYNQYGHTGLVWDNSGGTKTFTILEQNFDGRADTPARLRVDNFDGISHFIVPDFIDSYEPVAVKKVSTKRNTSSKLNSSNIPNNLTNSADAYFKATADSAGVSLAKHSIVNGKHNFKVTNQTYRPGAVFYVFEVVDGWCRVYSPTNNGWVWHERLNIKEKYKSLGGKKQSKDSKEVASQKAKQQAKLKKATNLTVGNIPPKNLKKRSNYYFRAKVDGYGATLCKYVNGKYVRTNAVYQPGYNDFYIFQVTKSGWCRVYSPTNNGWIWHERLRIVNVNK